MSADANYSKRASENEKERDRERDRGIESEREAEYDMKQMPPQMGDKQAHRFLNCHFQWENGNCFCCKVGFLACLVSLVNCFVLQLMNGKTFSRIFVEQLLLNKSPN